MGKAHIFLAFADAPDRDQVPESRLQHLPNLEEERKELVLMLYKEKHQHELMDVEHDTNVTSDRLFEHIIRIGNKLSILHYSGHAESLHLELQNTQYKTEQLVELIKGYDNIDLVFLNGCSTKGMVEQLLNAGIKAIIATSEKIGDASATQFSINFYKAFAKQGTSLKQAFNQACSQIAPLAVLPEDKRIIARGSFGSPAPASDTTTIPWGLYYHKDKADILEWALINEHANAAFDENLNQFFQSLQVDIQQKENDLKSLKDKLDEAKKAKEQLGALASNEAIAKIVNESYDTALQNFHVKQDELNQIYKTLKSKINEQRKDQNEIKLSTALKNLNYVEQLEKFQSSLTPTINSAYPKLGAFILQGSLQCGHELLRKRMMELQGININFKEIIIDLSANTFDYGKITELWREIGKYLDLATATAEMVVQEVHQKFIASEFKQDVVFFFNNAHMVPPKTCRALIKNFWIELNTYLQAHPKVENAPHILFFVVDKECRMIQKDGKWISNRDEVYEQTFADLPDTQQGVSIMPIIDPLALNELRGWTLQNTLPNQLGLNNDFFQQLAGEQGAFILPAIKNICEQANFANVYNELIKEYQITFVKNKL